MSALSEVMIDLFIIYRLGWGSAYREDSGEVCHRASRGSELCVGEISISLTRALVFFNLGS